MANKDVYILIVVVGIITMLFRILPVYIKVNDENEYVETFFEILPISIISVLVFPEIFTAMGTSLFDIGLSIFAMFVVIIMTIKKLSLAHIAIGSVILILILRGMYFGIF
ncbi:AzlD domain-containing protein [Oceanivirga miroungae]|uniref:Branched-chain amino acid transport n=1 Tax=Oceanivirga miroungae TaxID=1130046 RepID=A0A6I8MAP7_9FUSO|nr:AzlD domain-containing protein [Oceanivirga miroungae]VWL85853.1 branched-chain amino acid transport [Oceanivirga miroungae]